MTGSFTGTTSNSAITPKIEWSAVADHATNTSLVTATFLLHKDSSYTMRTYGTGRWILVIDGTETPITKVVTLYSSAGWVTVGTASKTVPHKADGTRSCRIYVTGSVPGTSYLSTVCSQTFDLETIPRPSTVSAQNAVMGAECRINIARASGTFRHTLEYSFMGHRGTIAEKTEQTAVTWQVPVSLASLIPSAVSGRAEIKCKTYREDGTLIGEKGCYAQLTVPADSAPEIMQGAVAVSPYNENQTAESWGIYLQNYSRAEVGFDLTKIQAKYGAEIVSCKGSALGQEITEAPYITGVFMASGAQNIAVTVTDSRGKTAEQNLTAEVLPYAQPTFSFCLAQRCTASGAPSVSGTYIKIECSAVFSPCAGQNGLSLRYRFKAGSAESFGAWTDMETPSLVFGSGGVEISSSYDVEVRADDALGNFCTRAFHIPTDTVAFNIKDGGSAVAFFKYAEEDGLVDIAGALRASDGIVLGSTALTEEKLIAILALLT